MNATARPGLVLTSRGPAEYAVFGEGPTVLALHGAMGGYDQGLLLARTVVGVSGFRFVAISRPGYLGTPLSIGPSPSEQADLCTAVLDALAIQHTGVIAISGGGQCALQFALRYPDRCSALVMISACSAQLHVRIPLRFHMMKLVARVPTLLERMRRKALADPEAAASRSIPDPDLRARTLADPDAGPLFAALQRSVTEDMAGRLPGTANDIRQSRLPFRYEYERIAAPTLVVHGTADEAAPYVHAQALASRVPGASLITIEGGRHVSIFTHRGRIQPVVSAFLSLHTARAPSPTPSVILQE